MRRVDAFFLGIAAFVLANSASYFFHSLSPNVMGFATDPTSCGAFEAIGFPFVMLEENRGIAPYYRTSLTGSIGNLTIGLAIGFLSAKHLKGKVPPIGADEPKARQYSLGELLCLIGCAALFLGVGTRSRFWGLVARNMLCFVGPFFLFGYLLLRRKVTWPHLLVGACVLTSLALVIELRHHDPPIALSSIVHAYSPRHRLAGGPHDPHPTGYAFEHESDYVRSATRRHSTVALMHVAVPTLGLLSFLAVASVAYLTIRQRHALSASKGGRRSQLLGGGALRSLGKQPLTDDRCHAVELTCAAKDEIVRRHSLADFGEDTVVRLEPVANHPFSVKVTFDFFVDDGNDWIGESNGICIVVDRTVIAELRASTIDFVGGEFVVQERLNTQRLAPQCQEGNL